MLVRARSQSGDIGMPQKFLYSSLKRISNRAKNEVHVPAQNNKHSAVSRTWRACSRMASDAIIVSPLLTSTAPGHTPFKSVKNIKFCMPKCRRKLTATWGSKRNMTLSGLFHPSAPKVYMNDLVILGKWQSIDAGSTSTQPRTISGQNCSAKLA